jgi:hypothetical protein
LVRVVIAGATPDIPLGAFGRIVITLSHRDRVTVLPAVALRGAVFDGAEVLVCKGGRVELRKIDVGFRDDTRVEVQKGIGPDDRVAVDHVLGLDDGTAVKELP